MRFIPLIGFLVLTVLLGFLLLTKPATNENTTTDKPLPVLRLLTLDSSQKWDQKKLLGQVTVLNFFASWCTPCEAEMPELAMLHEQFPSVRFQGVAWNDEPATISKWLKKNGNPFDTVWRDANGEATMALGLKGIPETLIIDAQSTVRYRLSGPVTDDIRTTVIAPLLQQLLEAHHAP